MSSITEAQKTGLPEVDFDFTGMAEDDDQLVAFALGAGRATFGYLAALGALNTPAAHVRIWDLSDEVEHELATATLGTGGEAFAANTQGKLETVLELGMDSDEAAHEHANDISPGHAHDWPGGVHRVARYHSPSGTWQTRTFGVACSGPWGAIDPMLAGAIADALCTGWKLSLKFDDEAGYDPRQSPEDSDGVTAGDDDLYATTGTEPM